MSDDNIIDLTVGQPMPDKLTVRLSEPVAAVEAWVVAAIAADLQFVRFGIVVERGDCIIARWHALAHADQQNGLIAKPHRSRIQRTEDPQISPRRGDVVRGK